MRWRPGPFAWRSAHRHRRIRSADRRPGPRFDSGLVDNRGISTSALHNRPTVLLVITDPCATCLVMLDDLARAYVARHDSVNLAALLWGKPTPELFAGIIDGGYRYPVVLRDGGLGRRPASHPRRLRLRA